MANRMKGFLTAKRMTGTGFLSRFGRVLAISLCLLTQPAGMSRAEAFTSSAANMMGSMANMMALMMLSPSSGYFGGWSPYSLGNPWMSGYGLPAANPWLSGPLAAGQNVAVPNVIVPPVVVSQTPATPVQTQITTGSDSGFPAIAGLQNQPKLFGNPVAVTNQALTGPGNFWLNGQYRASTGEMFQIRGKQFQLLTRQGSLTGVITSNGDLISLYVPQWNQTLFFQVSLSGNQLYLKEPAGNIQIFTRIGP